MILTDNLKLAQFIGTESAVPWNVAQAIITRVKRNREERKIDVEKHWSMYQGEHSNYFKQRKNEDTELFKYRKQNSVVANYIRYIVDLSGKYLYGRASKVSRRFSETTATDERFRKLLKMVQYENLMLEAAKKGCIFGETGFRLIPIDSLTMDQPENGVATETTFPMPILLDPTKTFFLTNKWNKITAVVVEDEYTDWETGNKHKTLELIVSDSRWFWDEPSELGNSKLAPKVEVKNLYNLNEEFVLAKNNDAWVDDIQDILGLNIQLDEMLTDNANFFAKHGWPQLVSSVDLSKVVNSPTHVWEVQSDGPQDKLQDKLFFLQWDGRMAEAYEFAKYIEAMIFKISSTARIATGDLEAIGQLRSGPAIVAAHSPSIQKTQEKQVVWCNNEMNLLYAMAAFDARLHGEAVNSRYADLEIYVTFPRDFVPGEELVRAEVQQLMAQNHTSTFKDIIRQNHPEFSEAEVEEYRKELMKDSEDIVDSEREFKTEQPGGQSGSSAKKSKEQA